MNTLYIRFIYAGTLPFIFFSALLVTGTDHLPVLGPIEPIFSVYALVIASFIAGSHWGQYLHVKDSSSGTLAWFSNCIALLLWVAFLLQSFEYFMASMAAVFVIMLLIDRRLYQQGMITLSYYMTRRHATVVLVISLVVTVMSLHKL